MTNPVVVLPGSLRSIEDIVKAAHTAGVDPRTLELVHLRVSQLNGCGVCVDGGAGNARGLGISDEQMDTVAVWRQTRYFSAQERAALALAEAATLIADRRDPVGDEVWDEAASHFDENQLAAIMLMIGVTNMVNRLNIATRQIAGESAWPAQTL